MNPTTTFYIDKRTHSLSLDGEWRFAYIDAPTDAPASLDYAHTATLPASGYRCLERAGILPDPYFGENSKLYEWADKKIWYFTRTFTLDAQGDNDVFLCFDGVGYACRVWLNGTLLGSHEGMFGGPIAEVGEYVRVGENELFVEVTPPAPDYVRYVKKRGGSDDKSEREIVPWNIRRDAETSNGDFTVFGIWRSVRIESVPKTHISRPYLYTKSIDGDTAKLHLSIELADDQIRELDVPANDHTAWSYYTSAFNSGLDARPTGRQVTLRVCLAEKDTGRTALVDEQTVDILDKRYLCPRSEYRECQFIEVELTLEHPKLWWPNLLGDANLYTVTIELSDESGLLDLLTFDTGVRTVTFSPSAGIRPRTRRTDFHFIINGKPIFLKGMNWMPLDFLYDITDADYRWALELAKNQNIQLIRVWSGGGMPEDDRFYRLCDELGLMVMQDNFIANQTTEQWNRKVLQSQVCQNLYRIRNHPSLAIHSGGNEHNPYALNNDAAMWVISREIADLDPSRTFWRATLDYGAAHIYRDMEPVWYRKIYGQLPFIGESGIHSFPNAKSLRQVISKEEYNRPLSDIFTAEFTKKNPELHNHFTEFVPQRIPRMMARASMISDIHGISLSDLCEATQLASYEFYQIMSNAMRENYPVTVGLMPWVFKRPWTTTAIQLLDGLGDPIAPYYSLKNAYAPLAAHIALTETIWAPGETITPDLRLICDDIRAYDELTVTLEIFSPTLELVRSESFPCSITPEEYQKAFTAAPFTLPEEFTEKYFFLRVSVSDASGELHQSVNWCKVLERMADEDYRTDYRENVHGNINFERGPWLKPQIAALHGEMQTELLGTSVREVDGERRAELEIRVKNSGEVPLFPIKLDAVEDRTLTAADDNYFFLPSGEERTVLLNVRVKDASLDTLTVNVTAWNADEVSLKIKL